MHPRLGRTLASAVPLVLLALPLTSCGDDPAADAAGPGTEPITARAVAAITADHLDEAPTAGRAAADGFGYDRPPTGADLDLGKGGADGRLSVMVGEGFDPDLLACEGDWADVLDGCEEWEGSTVMWQEEEPEEDPGILYVARRRGEAMVLVELGGPTFRGDPREQDLVVPVSTMAAVAGDDRLGALTTPAALRAGEGLSWFRGGPVAQPGDDTTAG